MARLKLDSGLIFTIEVDAQKNLLRLEASDELQGIRLAFTSCDMIDNSKMHRSAALLYNPVEGRKLFFHEQTRIDELENAVELHTCPIDETTKAPLPALMVHYRFEPATVLNAASSASNNAAGSSARSAVRITAWFSHRGPLVAHNLSWLHLTPADCRFRSFRGFLPEMTGDLSDLKHALRFPMLALKGEQGWAGLCECGEAAWTPLYPYYQASPGHQSGSADSDKVVCTDEMKYEGIFSAQASNSAKTDVSMYTEAHPLTAALVFGNGDVSFPTMPPRSFPKTLDIEGEMHTLKSGALTAAVMLRKEGVSILPINLSDLSVDRQPAMVSLVRLLLKHLPTGELLLADAERGWTRTSITHTGNSICIYLEGPEGIPDIAVKVEARAAELDRIEWRTHILNTNPEYTVLYASYPGTNFSGANPTAFLPEESGVIVNNVYSRAYRFHGPYPNGFNGTMAFFGLYDPEREKQNGLYVGYHDAGGSRKDFSFTCTTSGAGAIDAAFGAININRGANAFELAGALVWQIFDGDWYDLTNIYRDFVHNHAEWLPAYGRPDTPQWMRDLPLYIMDWMPADNPDADPIPISIRPETLPLRDDWYRTPIKLADSLDLPLGYHLYNWHWIPFNNDYPHYFPVKEGLAEGVNEMHRHRIRVMPYINGRIWDTKDRRDTDFRFIKEALPHTSKSFDNEPDLETYAAHEQDGSLVQLAAMCPSSFVWRKELLQIVKRLFSEYKMDAVYIDQVAAAYSNLCADETHNHTPGNGDWWVKAYRLLMDRLNNETPVDRGFTTESCAEVYADQFDGFLTWTWINSNLVPAMNRIYGGYIAMLGRNTNGYKKSDLLYYRYHVAQAVLFGQQIGWINPDLVYVPEKLSFMKLMAGLRYKYRDVFSQGEMLRPLRFQGDIPKIVTDTGMGRSMIFEGDALLAAAWKLDGKVQLWFVNVGDKDAECDASVRWAEYGIQPEKLHKTDGAGELLNAAEKGLRIALPKHGALVLEAPEE